MIEISDTNFRCNSCDSYNDVMNISLYLNGTTQRSSFRLCLECRKQLKKIL